MPLLPLSKFETIEWITDEVIKITTILQVRGAAIQNNSIRKQSMAAILSKLPMCRSGVFTAYLRVARE
jgi:hypothetical protein